MKKLLTNLALILVMQTLLLGTAFSSDRVDALFDEDNINALDGIQLQLYQLGQLEHQLSVVDFHLAKNAKGQSVYLKFEKIMGAVVVSAIIAGTSIAHVPNGLRAILAADITSKGLQSGIIVLKDVDVTKIRNDIALYKSKIKTTEVNLKKNAEYYCGLVDAHAICPRY